MSIRVFYLVTGAGGNRRADKHILLRLIDGHNLHQLRRLAMRLENPIDLIGKPRGRFAERQSQTKD